MKVVHYLSLFALAAAIGACSSSQYATDGRSYENDDVYYQKGESFISDFAIVDDPDVAPDPAPAESAPATAPADDEYYEEATAQDNTSTDQGVTHNYYGSVYNYGGFNNGFAPNYYAGFNNGWYNPWQPGLNLVWDPYRGWHVSYLNNFGWGNYWNDPWGWNSPCYDPWFYNSWCWNSWNSPYGFYNPYGWNSPYCYNGNYWFNGYGNGYYYEYFNNGFGNSNVVFGQRPSLTVANAINSSYSNGNWNAGRLQYKPLIQNDVVEDIQRIKDDYHQTLAAGGAGMSSAGKSNANASSVVVGSSKRKPQAVVASGESSNKGKTPPASMKNNGGSVRPIQDSDDSSGGSNPIFSQPDRGSRPSTGSTPATSPRPSPSPRPSTSPAPRPSVSDGGKAKPSAPPSAPRRKVPGMASGNTVGNSDQGLAQRPAKSEDARNSSRVQTSVRQHQPSVKTAPSRSGSSMAKGQGPASAKGTGGRAMTSGRGAK